MQASRAYTEANADCFMGPIGRLARRTRATYTIGGDARERPPTRRGRLLDIVQRAKAMVLSPAAEWRVIEPESGDPGYLIVNYVAFLAAIPPASIFLRGLLFGWRGPRMGFHHFHHFGFFSGLFGAVVHWLVALVVVYAHGGHHRRAGADLFGAEEPAERDEARGLLDRRRPGSRAYSR